MLTFAVTDHHHPRQHRLRDQDAHQDRHLQQRLHGDEGGEFPCPPPSRGPLTSTLTRVQIPVTQTKEVDYTVEVTVGSGATVTQQSLTVIYASRTVSQTRSQAPVTVVQPTTSIATTAPAVVTAAGHANNAPAVAFIAGIIGAVVLV